MTTREIVRTFKEMYGADASPALISKVTNAVIEEVVEWQSRPLDGVCPIVYLDCIVVKIRQDKRVINKAVYLALGVNMEGHKELLGLWIAENEGAKFWLNVLTELQNRGVKDIRKAIYTTNAIESLNSVIRKAIKKRKLFPTDDSAKKVIYLAIQDASKRWTMPIRNWKLALNRFMIEFEDRLVDYI